jgi:hypothetical protein
MNSRPKQRREGEANSPRGQRPPGASRTGPSWTEFVRPAHQAVVAIAGADMTNHAEPKACGHSRGSRRLDTEPETERTAGPASNAAGDGCRRAQDDEACFQPCWGKPAVRNEQSGWRKRGHDLMAICHNARKGRHTGSHRSKPVAPPLHSTSRFDIQSPRFRAFRALRGSLFRSPPFFAGASALAAHHRVALRSACMPNATQAYQPL